MQGRPASRTSLQLALCKVQGMQPLLMRTGQGQLGRRQRPLGMWEDAQVTALQMWEQGREAA